MWYFYLEMKGADVLSLRGIEHVIITFDIPDKQIVNGPWCTAA